MGAPDYKLYERLRNEGNSNAGVAEMMGLSAAYFSKIGYVKRYNTDHPTEPLIVRNIRPLKDYLHTDNEYYRNERAPRMALINKANELRRVLFERYGDHTKYADDDPDWDALRKLNEQMK